MAVTKDMLMGDILKTDKAETIAEILMAEGMHCVGCPSSLMESLEDACAVHGIDVEPVLAKINAAIA
ncbi:MAG: DUF1858 domain-containing protein [Lachnospiraceae bacterium]|nr:DUF1858 domain-containing protein [Lachnospiraceae bacterium]